MAPMELYHLCSIGGCELALFLQREDGVALGSHYMHGGRDPLSSWRTSDHGGDGSS